VIAGLKRVLLALVLLGALGTIGLFGWRWYDRSREFQYTNDAYVRGEITTVSARVAGYSVEVLVDDNYPVKASQVLVRLDPRDFHMAVERAQAALDQAKASREQVSAQRELERSKILVAAAALRAAVAQAKNADISLQRSSTLAADSFASRATVDADTATAAKMHSDVDEAQANLAYESEQLAVIAANETMARAQVASAEAALLSAKFALEDTEVWAPIDGIVANRKTRVGEYVTPGTSMLSIVPISNLWIEANYRETQVGRMQVGDPVSVEMDTYPGKTLCGYVESIAPASGSEFALIPPDNATGNFTKIVRRFTVRIRFNVSEKNASLARPGMSVETAVAVGINSNASAERARRLGCAFDPAHDMVERQVNKLPEHPGLGRARPQGPVGLQSSPGAR
jgi:membrane fusion protein, multidrug efflux system